MKTTITGNEALKAFLAGEVLKYKRYELRLFKNVLHVKTLRGWETCSWTFNELLETNWTRTTPKPKEPELPKYAGCTAVFKTNGSFGSVRHIADYGFSIDGSNTYPPHELESLFWIYDHQRNLLNPEKS